MKRALCLALVLTSLVLPGAAGCSRKARMVASDSSNSFRARFARSGCELHDGAIVRGPKEQKTLALVFTGHEYGESGMTILDELARHNARASFFLTGVFLEKPEFAPLLLRIRREGHYLGPHSDRHLLYCPWDGPKTTLVSQVEFEKDFAENLKKIRRAAGAQGQPGYFLPPYEHYNLQIVSWAAKFNFITVNFTPGTRSNADYTGEHDRNFVSSDTIFESIIAREQRDPHGLNGFILLLHIGAGPGRTDKFHARFGELMDYLACKGYQFITIGDLLKN